MEKKIDLLLKDLKKYFKEHNRSHLPWRNTKDPYKILVSEIMLQQTQVDRVIPYFNEWIQIYPTLQALASSRLQDTLMLWQGLGYNRRAKLLREAAAVLINERRGTFPKTAGEIEELPGVGPYTARAIAIFAFNKPEICIETNIRSVFLHYCFPDTHSGISDTDVLPLIQRALKKSRMQPRDFYAALMDYGSFLKRSGVRNNNKSRHYTKQTRFQGSRRQLRGHILKLLLRKPLGIHTLVKQSGRNLTEVTEEIERMQKELLLERRKSLYCIAQK